MKTAIKSKVAVVAAIVVATVVAAVVIAAVGQVNNSMARHNIKQQIKVNTTNKHTAVVQVCCCCCY